MVHGKLCFVRPVQVSSQHIQADLGAAQAWVHLLRLEQNRNARLRLALQHCQRIQLRASWCAWREALRQKRQRWAQARHFRRLHAM